MRFIHSNRAESPLPQMPRHPHPGVDITGVMTMHMTECLAQAVCIAWNRDDVNVIGHQAVRPYLNAVSTCGLGQQIKIQRIIAFFKKRLLSPIAPLCHMMRDTGKNHARKTCHANKLLTYVGHVNLGVIAPVTVIPVTVIQNDQQESELLSCLWLFSQFQVKLRR